MDSCREKPVPSIEIREKIPIMIPLLPKDEQKFGLMMATITKQQNFKLSANVPIQFLNSSITLLAVIYEIYRVYFLKKSVYIYIYITSVMCQGQ